MSSQYTPRAILRSSSFSLSSFGDRASGNSKVKTLFPFNNSFGRVREYSRGDGSFKVNVSSRCPFSFMVIRCSFSFPPTINGVNFISSCASAILSRPKTMVASSPSLNRYSPPFSLQPYHKYRSADLREKSILTSAGGKTFGGGGRRKPARNCGYLQSQRRLGSLSTLTGLSFQVMIAGMVAPIPFMQVLTSNKNPPAIFCNRQN